ncbi:MAG: VanZ family protein [Alkaliphilus sp.]
MKRRQIIISISWLAVLLWMALIFNLSSQPANQSNKLSEGITKVIVDTVERVALSTDFDLSRLNHIVRKNAHFFAYLVLAFLKMECFSSNMKKNKIKIKRGE